MITQISGKLSSRGEGYLVVLVNGLGYQILVPTIVEKAFQNTAPGENVRLETIYFLQIEQNKATPVLIGFENAIQREFFERLLTVPRVGPKAALAAFTRPVSTLAAAIEAADYTVLQALPGVGKQKARDLVATLQGKVQKFALMQDSELDGGASPIHDVTEEALQLLTMLGHKRLEAERMVNEARVLDPNAPDAETLVRVIYRRQQERKSG